MNKLSGYIPIRNGTSQDYCWRETAASLLPVCDELVLCDSDSTDGTREAMDEWAKQDSKIRVINYPWPSPVGDNYMLIKWLNWIRPHLRYSMQLTTDADEVLCPKSYPSIRKAVEEGGCRWFRRLNFWQDNRHVAPLGTVVGEYVARLGPTELEMVSDEGRPQGEPEIRQRAIYDDTLRFFHYGFIRNQQAFFAKSKVVQRAIHNDYDKRMVRAEEEGVHWATYTSLGKPLVDYPYLDHPEVAHSWLRKNGWEVP